MSEQKQPLGILFDMDGLLLDTEDLAVRAWKVSAEKLGHPIPHPVMVETIGVDERTTKAIVLSHMGESFPYDEIQLARRALMQQWMEESGIPVRPGAEDTLRRLRAAGLKTALATSTDQERALWRMDRLDWRGYFDGFAFGDEVEKGKPAPDIFLLAAKRIGVAPHRCIVLEDSPGGLTGARAAGMTAIFIPDLKAPDPHLRALAHMIFPDLTTACDHILRLARREGGLCAN